MILGKFRKPVLGSANKVSFYLMLLLAVAMLFLPFHPAQKAEAGILAVIVVAVVITLIAGECNEAGGSESSSYLPPVPEFVDVFSGARPLIAKVAQA